MATRCHLASLEKSGLQRGDHFAIFMENNSRYLEACGAGDRSGLYYTCVNSFLKADELTYILNNSESQLLITSAANFAVAKEAMAGAPGVRRCLVVDVDVDGGEDDIVQNFQQATQRYPGSPIADESQGAPMLYSSGTTGQPKAILRTPEVESPAETQPLAAFLDQLWAYRDEMVYLSPAPLYHSAPQMAVGLALRRGSTVVVMRKFDPESYLALVDKYSVTHSQLVPTMFSKMLKLPEEVRNRYSLKSLEVAVHAAAPCPVPVKEAMVEWWGPIIREYYGSTEAIGFTACDSQEWLEHKGTVGRVLLGDIHILDDDGNPVPPGEPGEIWFANAVTFSYFNNSEKSREAMSADGTMATVGDVGYLEDGFLFLTDRATFMIISGGVNIYPQETENLLITHPQVADAAVFGVPNEELGEEVKAVVQPMPGVVAQPP